MRLPSPIADRLGTLRLVMGREVRLFCVFCPSTVNFDLETSNILRKEVLPYAESVDTKT